MLTLENAFGLDRSALPCEAVCDFVDEDEGAGENLDATACELTLEEPGANPEDIVGSVRCEGETFYSCE